ncbi:scarecrow-like protein 14 isoform X1 [Argentina anserina]|uniref:scarecrow-like protein 14 isoform X1 n=1 Tax=Argentina anserina TaxID=57926 RepID=UPI0021766622|nr:scarecrow-like protein 14 isoform X1 [Potentilla anserina]
MDTLQRYSVPGFKLDHVPVSVYPNSNLANGFKEIHESSNPVFLASKSHLSSDSNNESSEVDGVDINDFNNPVLKYISDILLEEDLEGKPCMMQDCLALQAAEKSFYDVLVQKDPPFPNRSSSSVQQSFESSDDDFPQSSQSSNRNCSYAVETDWVWDPAFSPVQSSVFESFSSTLMVSDSFPKMQSLGEFGGVGKASKFLSNTKLDMFDSERFQLMPQGSVGSESGVDGYNSTNETRGKKNHQREDSHFPEEERSSKQSAGKGDDFEPQEMFDKVLLGPSENYDSELCADYDSLKTEGDGKLQRNKQSKGLKAKRQSNIGEVVDLCTMLTQCAQAVANFDQQTANELLKQIRKHSTPHGDATQRLAHYFADGLQTRLAGAKTPSYSPLVSVQISAAEILNAYRVYITACPFIKMSHFFANRTIMKLSENATRLHIIDFGISYGFQWPCLIQCLSQRPGGPPKLRITAIELPQPGLRPTERVEETGRRLEKYAKRFAVPFEYNMIAQKWETIRIEDIKIDRSELNVVNCLYRLKNIPDETVMASSPRDSVLKLIRNISPDLFIHGVCNGTHNAPFFTRFREALLHYYSLFDMFEATVSREDELRFMFEQAIYGRDVVNVVACEGVERVERPETYRQWQVRNVRAGFKQLPLDQTLLKKVKTMSKVMRYHNDFRVDEDGHWMLQGWKGRIIMALSFWKST